MSNDFILRLKQLLRHFELTPSGFADQVGVPRSSMSHLLSGRNKPSLDFTLKVIDKFPEVNLYWLLNGKGNFPTVSTSKATPTPNGNPKEQQTPIAKESTFNTLEKQKNTSKKVQRVIIFYTDGTFESYNPEK